MAKCEICGKGRTIGNTIQHQYGGGWFRKAQKKKREFKPNIQKLKIKIAGGSTSVRINICTHCLKTYKNLTQVEPVEKLFISTKKEKAKV